MHTSPAIAARRSRICQRSGPLPRSSASGPTDRTGARSRPSSESSWSRRSSAAMRPASPCGPGPSQRGIFALDEDGPGALALLAAKPGELPRTLLSTSGRPGHGQWFFAVPEEGWPAVRNRTVLTGHGETSAKASLRFASMISCLPPGLHPAGRRYRWEAGLGPGEIEPAEIPRLLLDRAEYEPREMASIVNAAWRGDLARVAEALADGSCSGRARRRWLHRAPACRLGRTYGLCAAAAGGGR